MQSASVTLMNNETGIGDIKQWPGGRGMFIVEATFGAGNVDLQYLGPFGSWLSTPAVSLSAGGGVLFELPPGSIRAVAAVPTNVYAIAARIPV